METIRDIGAILQVLVFAGLAIATVRLSLNRGGEAGKWLAAAFGTLAVVVVAGQVTPEDSKSTLVEVARKVDIAVLLLFPWLLFRFAASFRDTGRTARRATDAALVGIVVVTAAVPPFPLQNEPQPDWVAAYLVGFLLYWTALSVQVALRLWRGGRSQTAAVRYGMRLLCLGSVLLNVVLLVAGGASGSGESIGREVALQALVLASALLFFLGFAPPAAIVGWWRAPETDAFQRAQEQLMSALTVEQVAEALLPAASRLVGGGVVLGVEGSGTLSTGIDPDEVAALVAAVPADLPPFPATVAFDDGAHVAALRRGWIAVRPGPYTPLFGDGDLRQFRTLAHVADLALERVRLFERIGERDEQFRVLLEGVHDHGFFLLDDGGRVVSWNPAAARVCGLEGDEAIGSHFSRFYVAEATEAGVPDDVLARAAAEGRAEDASWRVRGDGSRFWADVAVTRLDRAESSRAGFAVVVRDLTDRRQAEDDRRHLEVARSRQRQALEINDGIVQGLVVAKMALNLGEEGGALEAVEGTLAQARAIVTDLLDEARGGKGLAPGDLVRERPADISGEHRLRQSPPIRANE